MKEVRLTEGLQSQGTGQVGDVSVGEGELGSAGVGEGAAAVGAVVVGEGGVVLCGALLGPPCAGDGAVLCPLPHAVGEPVVELEADPGGVRPRRCQQGSEEQQPETGHVGRGREAIRRTDSEKKEGRKEGRSTVYGKASKAS